MTDKTQKKQKTRPITPDRLQNIALYYLERFSSSSANLRNVLTRRVQKSAYEYDTIDQEGCAQEIERIITRFQENGLLNDQNYANSLTHSLHNKGKSQKAIHMKLKQKGLNDHHIRNAMEQLQQEEDGDLEYRAALTYARKRRLGPFRTQNRIEKQEKDMAALARQGFSYDIVKRVINDDTDE